MRLYAIGCSMTYGSELCDDPVTGKCLDDAYRTARAWPERLRQQLGWEDAINAGEVSSSNDRLVRTTVSWLLNERLLEYKETDIFVAVAWSGPMRREFHVNGRWRQVIPYHDQADPDLQELVLAYRKHAWNDYESAARFATQVLTLQAFLRQARVPYLFCDAIESCAVAFSHGDAAIQRQAAHIDRDRYFNFDQMDGSMAGVLTREAPQWKGRHPGEDGHAIWASHLAEFIKNGNLDRPPDLVRTFERTQGSLTLLARLFGRVAAKPSRDRDPFIYP